LNSQGANTETEWNQKTTHQGNYSNVGIVSDPNKVHGVKALGFGVQG